MKRSVFLIVLLFSLAFATTTFAQDEEAPKASGSMGFKAEPAPLPANATPLQQCDARVASLQERIKADEVGKPYLIAGYLAFFFILVAFSALAARRQRKLEAEMTELRARLAKLQEGH